MADVPADDLPDLAAEAGFHEFLDDCPDLAPDASDPLLPADRTVAGVTEVEHALRTARRVTMGYPARDGLGPTPITPSRAKEIVESARRSPGLVFLTGRCEGPDLMLWTVEVLVGPTRPRIR